MRLSFPLVLALSGLTSQVSARFYHHHPEKRDTTDVCANLVNTAITFQQVPGTPPTTIGLISTCVCLSTIPNLLQTNVVLLALVSLSGAPAATAQLTTLINRYGSICDYPEHAQPVCTNTNACAFTCGDGFQIDGNTGQCSCPLPNIECNGVCGTFDAGCPSSQPELPVRKRSILCEGGMTACGIDGWSRRPAHQAWECLDTQSDLESCGGCAFPLALTSPRGVDCTSIPHVADVSCAGGSCVVHDCDHGYTPSHDKTYCVPTKHQSSEEILASAYGLEHYPLKRNEIH
ncbi:hypothetical protein QCA50_016370 [Cerrena zonata]|uniref:Protein CPL1-like domain-containing protein n=1 Tax=Cerrena zonata TaxID=2478898 RepID=A0AAW0FFT8_9APHY